MSRTLDPFFRPRAIAVIGASRRRGTIAGEVFHNLLAHGFPGPVHPVNPAARAVQSVRAYPTVVDIPDEVDLAVIVVPGRKVAEAVDQCAAKGVKAIVVVTAGFAEMGAEGRARQDAVLARVRAGGMRMVGPNCLGILSTDPIAPLDATFAPTWPPEGTVAIASQSGAIGLALLDYARELGIGISQFVSTGNKADVSGNDLLEHWEGDPRTRVILLYLESFGRPDRFVEIARRVSRRKPIVAVKSGRTEAGARAATSHTGALAGMDVAVDALLWQAGVLRADTIEELFDLAALLASQPVPAGPRVAILTNGGGPGIMASDACESRGLEVTPLGASTAEALRAFLPPEASASNPVDLLASAPAEHYERALRILLADERVDAVLVLFVPPIVTEAGAVAEAIQRGIAGMRKPVLASFLGTHGIPAALSSLRQGRIPSYAFPEAAALALSRAVRYGRWLARRPGVRPDLAVDAETGRAIVAAHPEGWLGPAEAQRLLRAYGIPIAASDVVRTPEQAVAAAERIGYPVAVKLVSSTITHKTEVEGVALDLEGPEAVRRAVARIRAALEHRGRLAELEGILVQAMRRGGVETYVGMTHAEKFGALLAFGIGGLNVEIWRDVAFRVHPITDVDAREMLDEIRGRPLLQGFRGAPPVDRDALVDVLLRLDRMVGDLPAIEEIDVNPLLALPPGQGAVALDVRVRISQRGHPAQSR